MNTNCVLLAWFLVVGSSAVLFGVSSADQSANSSVVAEHRNYKNCDFHCDDLHPSCDNVYLDEDFPGEVNCSKDVWKNRCPRTCHMCNYCNFTSIISKLYSRIEKIRPPALKCDPDELMEIGGCASCYTVQRSILYMGNHGVTFLGPPGDGRLIRIRNYRGTIQDGIAVTRHGRKEVIYGGSSPTHRCEFDIPQDNPIVKVEGVMMASWVDSDFPAVWRLRYQFMNGTKVCTLPDSHPDPDMVWNPPVDGCFLHGFYGHAFINKDYMRGVGMMWACPKLECPGLTNMPFDSGTIYH